MRNMKLQIVLLLALVILPISALAQEKSFSETQLTTQGQKAFQTLLSAPQFESTHIGYSGAAYRFAEFREFCAKFHPLAKAWNNNKRFANKDIALVKTAIGSL